MSGSQTLTGWRLVQVLGGLLLMAWPMRSLAEPSSGAVAGFDAYVRELEARLGERHKSDLGFVAGVDSVSGEAARLRRGEFVLEPLTAGAGNAAAGLGLPGATVYAWRGTAFVPGARVAEFERLLRDFAGYPKVFAPEVLRAGITHRDGDSLAASMRVQQKHILTVVMDTSYDVRFGRLDAEHGFSASRSTRVVEVAGAGTAQERVLSAEEEHGFLWRLNTYWSYEARDGGLYVQVESVTLTRAIPKGLGWAVRPFVESVPRESLEFTLRQVCRALTEKGDAR